MEEGKGSTDSAVQTGYTTYYIDDDNILIQTAVGGVLIIQSDGTVDRMQADDWYYKIKVWKLGWNEKWKKYFFYLLGFY